MFWIILISRSRRSAYSARSCFRVPLARMASRRGRALFEALRARRIRSRCRWCARAERRSCGNGSLTFSSLTWQRWAISQVRSSACSEFAEELHHLVARLQVEVGRVPAHAVRVVERLAGLDAEQDFVRARVVLAEVVGIVGGDEREARSRARGG